MNRRINVILMPRQNPVVRIVKMETMVGIWWHVFLVAHPEMKISFR